MACREIGFGGVNCSELAQDRVHVDEYTGSITTGNN
jgi:hypothetical protein